ncbi:collagen alpha-1(VI) chain-like isoform X2 [Montipora capricornis]|uniref:collagen alpha-1(VI) chain-like isoform X2 n=1 Tax=Montipora capricornis TaxID=246305 RepID=UPI0035F17CA9
MEGPGQTLLLLFCILSFFGSCLTVVLFIRNLYVERQVKELELWQESEQVKATANYPAGCQNTANKDNTPAPGKVHVKRSPDRRGPKGRRGLAPGMTGVDGKNGIPGAKGESGIRVAMQGNKDETEIPDVIEEKVNQRPRESSEDELEDSVGSKGNRDIRENKEKKEKPVTGNGENLSGSD